MKSTPRTLRLASLAVIVAALLAFLNITSSGDRRENGAAEVDFSMRNPDFPATHISHIDVDLTSPNHWVTLTWTGSNAADQETGPFRSSPGMGLGNNDCNDVEESNRADSQCTPKGQFTIVGIADSLPSVSTATYVTWIDMSRTIALHYYPEVPEYPASAGCIRLDERAARLIHNNSVVGKTVVDVDGTWTRPLDRAKLINQLVAHEGKRWRVYEDSLGIKTVGVGFNLERPDARQALEAVGADFERVHAGGDQLTDVQIDRLLERDIEEAIENCRRVFPRFAELSDVRQRVLVDMMFNLGAERFQTFERMIAAVRASDFVRASEEMHDSRWRGQVGKRATTLIEFMRTGRDESVVEQESPDAIVDSNMTRAEAMDGLHPDCPQSIADQQELIEVRYYSFDGQLHQGQLVIHNTLAAEVQVVFRIARDYRFPIASVIPVADARFRVDGRWDDQASMAANNSSAFNYRKTADGGSLSHHALGRAIDINPMQNPYLNRGVTLPSGATYVPSTPGTLTADHPMVQAFLELGWEWGGHWTNQKDYQHFEKPGGIEFHGN